MRKFLIWIFVLQEVSNRNRNPKLGKGFDKAHRLNPFNPFTYLVIILAILTGLLLFGFIGIKREMDFSNPFKWN
jgi:hypothetical protein